MPTDLKRAEYPELPKEIAEWVQDRLNDLNVVYDAASHSLRLEALHSKKTHNLKHGPDAEAAPSLDAVAEKHGRGAQRGRGRQGYRGGTTQSPFPEASSSGGAYASSSLSTTHATTARFSPLP